MKVKFSQSISYLILLIIIGGLQFVQAKPVDESKIQINGKVQDENGHPVPGATIRILNSHAGAVSEADGAFQLLCPKDSSCKLSVEAVGFQKSTITFFPEKQRDEPFLIELQSQAGNLDDITVSATRRTSGSVNLVYQAQKKASAISDGISQDIIKKSPDKNMGDVLKRVSGASVQDDKFVIIRGLNERYNTAQMNKALLPSTEPDKRAFAFDIIPASLIDQVLIYKSMTPDLPPDFAGGAIDITTKNFPTRRVSELSLSLGYDTKTTFKSFQKAKVNGKYDFLGYFDGKRSLPASYLNNEKDFIHKSPDFKKAVTEQFSNNFGSQSASNSLPDMSIAYTGGNTRYTSTDKKFGYIYSLGYSVSREVTTGRQDDYDLAKRAQMKSHSTEYNQKFGHYALLNLSYAFNTKNRLAFKNLYNNSLTNKVELKQGTDYTSDHEKGLISSSARSSRDGLLQSVLQGEHELKKAQAINWNLSYARTYHYSPDETILSLDENADGTYGRRINNENSPALQHAGRVYSDNVEQQFGGHIDYSYGFNIGTRKQLFKAGISSYYRLKDVAVRALGYATLNGLGENILADPNDPFNMINQENIEKYNLVVANIGTSSAQYKGKAFNNYGYLMFENKWSDYWTLVWGANISNYDQKLDQKGHDRIEKKNTDILPSGILTFRPTDKMNLRLAASQSVNRPEFRELAAYNLYDYSQNYIYFGNPDLERSKATNFDFRYEFFPAAGEIMSASVFYKKFKDPIEQINNGNNTLGYENADEATLYGAEIEIRKKLDFLGSDFMSKWTVYGNAAYIDGNVKLNGIEGKSLMQGQSPYLVGAGLSYTEGDMTVNVLYQKNGSRLAFRGQRLKGQQADQAALDIYEKGRDVLDAQISYKFLKSKRLEVRLSAKDLLAQSIDWYYKFKPLENSRKNGFDPKDDLITRQFNPGTNVSLSLKYQF